MITIVEAKTKKEIKDFVKFPFSLYENNPYWVPPLISEEVASFDKNINPVFKTAEAYYYLAYKNDKIVGRIVAIINWEEVNKQGKRKVRFGWWDVIDDVEVTKSLLEKVYELGRKNNMEYVEGPIGFSNLDKVGVVTEGFDEIGSMITWYNHPYYKDHLEALGFVKEKEYIESKFPFDKVNPDLFSKANELIKKRYELKAVNFTKTSEIIPYVDKMFALFNASYARLSSFVAITDEQIAFFKKKYMDIIVPEYLKFLEDKDGNVIAFSIVMPSYSEALQKSKGKLFPFGFYHFLKAKNNSNDVLFYLIGVHPDYQSKGVTALIFNEYYNVFKKKGVKNCIQTPELEDNIPIQNLWKHFDPIIFRRRRTYKKNI